MALSGCAIFTKVDTTDDVDVHVEDSIIIIGDLPVEKIEALRRITADPVLLGCLRAPEASNSALHD